MKKILIALAVAAVVAACAYISGPCEVTRSGDGGSAKCEEGGVLMLIKSMMPQL